MRNNGKMRKKRENEKKKEKMSKKREYEKKKRDYENKKLFKIQKGKKPENITKNAHCNAKNVSQQVAQYKNVVFSGIVFTLLVLQVFSYPD